MTSHTRDSESTQNLIIEALGRILTEKGFTGVGINAVAREAGVDKVLIYRYFGSMEGLLRAFRDRKELCPNVVDVLDEFPEGTPLSVLVKRLLLKSGKAFRESTLAQELARWELTEKNPLTVAFSRSMEQSELKSLKERGVDPDPETVTAVVLLLSGIHYLTLRQSIKNPILDIDLGDPETVERVERVVQKMVEGYFAGREELPYAH
jgi:AcrR family transcriptional regulator